MTFTTFEADNIGLHSLTLRTAAENPMSVVKISSDISALVLITGFCSTRGKKEVIGSLDDISLTSGLLGSAECPIRNR
jgi:hypothetical protein